MKLSEQQLYIRQGRSLQKLLQKTNTHGGHRHKIEEIDRKIKQMTRQQRSWSNKQGS